MITEQLIPSIDKRITAWLENQKREKSIATQSPPTITVSREFGCEGYPLAEALKKNLDQKSKHPWTIFDDSLIKMIQENREYSKHLLKSFGERSKFMDDLIDMISPSWDSEEDVFRVIVDAIFAIAQEGHAIIVGRGAFAITKDLSNCYHIRLKAPLAFKAQSISRRLNISEEEALKIIQKKEKERVSFLRRLLNCELTMDYFHVIFDNSKASVGRIANTFVHFIGEID